MIAYRKMGQMNKAKAVIDSLLDDLPLYHLARFEDLLLGTFNEANKNSFASLIRSELSFETFMEMAEWYETVGCKDEALILFSFIDDYPIANYKRAWLLYEKGNISESLEMLDRANELSPEYIFPFRSSTIKVLEWAKTLRPNWKIDYYEGLIYWANQNKEKALELFDNCGEVEYAPFYLSRASLKKGEGRLMDLLKAEQKRISWRTGFALINYYVADHLWEQAVEVGEKYMKRYPSNYYIGLKYAKSLCEMGQYSQCISLLNKMSVLPNEGAYEGRAVYRAANLYRAIEQLNLGNYESAMKSVEDSKKWPENLGVGKPYDNMIDNRLENYLEAKVAKNKEIGRKNWKFFYWLQIINFQESISNQGIY